MRRPWVWLALAFAVMFILVGLWRIGTRVAPAPTSVNTSIEMAPSDQPSDVVGGNADAHHVQREHAGPSRPPQAASQGQAEQAAVDHCNNLVQGQLAYQPNTTMREGQKTLVTARIARGEDKDILVGLPDGTKENILVTCTVNAFLTAPDKGQFDIVQETAVSQPRFLGQNTAEQWRWQVTPLAHGTNMHLLLSVVPLVSGAGGSFPTRLREIDRQITVTANRPYEAKKALSSLWAVFGGAAFLGGGIAGVVKWLSGRYQARKKKPKAAPGWETP